MSNNASWADGLEDELNFWNNWVKNRGGEFSKDFEFRVNPASQVEGLLKRIFDMQNPSNQSKILDVGAGPLTCLGKYYGDLKLNISAVDALAPLYDKLSWGNINREPITMQCKTEELDQLYAPFTFDYVYAQNTLDHHFDAPLAFKQMIHVAKRGGIIATSHHENEASHGRWTGLHGWNFFIFKNDLKIANYEKIVSLKELISPFANLVSVNYDSSGDIETIIQKN
jgi:SAM-dependent methyltransferase